MGDLLTNTNYRAKVKELTIAINIWKTINNIFFLYLMMAKTLPDNLKNGIETLSGISMDGVKVHFGSGKPAQLNALAYAKGTDIELTANEEEHLPHEAWHVVQQKQGRVRQTAQLKPNIIVNDNADLEKEANDMGAKAAKF